MQATALALLNAVQHVQRTSLLAEAAVAGGLARAPASGAGPDNDWTAALKASGLAMDAATQAFRETLALATDLANAPSA